MSSSERTRWRGAALAALIIATARAAEASPDFPEALASELDMPCPPTCTVCHRDLNGGFFTVTKPFGKAMIDVGKLSARSPEEIPAALQALDAAASDSDGDGTSDVDELTRGEDPNRPGAQSLCGPEYGCGAQLASAAPRWHAPAFLFASALIFALRRRTR